MSEIHSSGELTERTISGIRKLLQGSARLVYIFECGKEDLKSGINHRTYRLSSNSLVMRARFADTDVFYTAGKLNSDDIDWIFSFGGKAEIHCSFEQKPLVISRDTGKRISSFHPVRYYRLHSSEVSGESSQSRLIQPGEFSAVLQFMREHGDEPVFYEDMKSWPAFGIWDGSKLVAYARTIFLNPSLHACQLGHFLTHPNYRGRGYAKDLGRALIRKLSETGITVFRLDVYEKNTAACRAYEALGFEIEDIAPMAEVRAPR